MNFLKKLKEGLFKSSTNLSEGIGNIFLKSKPNELLLNEIEEFMIKADFGIDVAEKIKLMLANQKFSENELKKEAFYKIFSEEISKILKPLEKKIIDSDIGLKTIIVCGVNGTGKTTTIGKLSKIFKEHDKKIVIGAADTFRAAAIDQLKIWCEKNNTEMIQSEVGSDPASVAFKTLEYAKNNQKDLCIIDTAGRLHNKKNLMEEFAKIIRVIKKIDSEAPQETWIVLDATTGQNALIQVEEFQKITNITGIIMTKLDGTAKGGILVAIADRFKIPIIAIGVGEKENDLHQFVAEEYSEALIK
jgi:fused signal recognition particle receptor|tara:strand:+ start:2685 stop:3593 length:909 start_codon:yes stop_codon:yes gene_type:complete